MQPNPSEHPRAGDTQYPRREPVGGNSFGGTIAAVLVAFFLILALGGIATGVIGTREIATPVVAPAPVTQGAPTTAPSEYSAQPSDPVAPQPLPQAGPQDGTPPQPSPTVPAPAPTP